MSSLPLSMPLPVPAAPRLAVGPVTAPVPAPAVAAPLGQGAFVAAELAELALPAASTPGAATPAAGAAAAELDSHAMRPDQVVMARQLSFQRGDAASLGASWRSMVRNYGRQLMVREQQALAGQLPPAALAVQQQGSVLPQPLLPAHLRHAIPDDAWRFTVHANGAQAQHLSVVAQERDEPPGRRRRGRAALRLEIDMPDGTRVTVQVEPVPGGVSLALHAPDARTLGHLRELQPTLEAAVQHAGLQVMRWTFSDRLPAAPAHAALAAHQAESVLTPAVFRAVAELALMLPAAR